MFKNNLETMSYKLQTEKIIIGRGKAALHEKFFGFEESFSVELNPSRGTNNIPMQILQAKY